MNECCSDISRNPRNPIFQRMIIYGWEGVEIIHSSWLYQSLKVAEKQSEVFAV